MQRLLVLGLNHKTAPLDLRERLAFSPEQRKAALLSLRAQFDRCEAVLISTCNRVELYVARETHGHPRHAELAEFLAQNRALKLEDLQSRLYHKTERDVVSHLFSVAASLDSMVLGETQILAQVREAYEAAKEAGTAGPVLHPLFQRAVAVGKQIRAQTALGEGRVSVASVAVDYARRIFDVFTDKTVLSIGAGKMAERVLAAVAALKPGRLIVCNRDAGKATALAERFAGSPAEFEQLPDHLAAADIVITSTGSDKPIITRSMFDAVIRRRRYRPVFLIDIAVPRDVAADVAKIENVYLYNLDDLQQAVTATQDKRSAVAEAAARIVEQHVSDFAAWNRARMMGPLIDHLYQRSHALAQEELARTVAKLSGVTDADKQQLEELTRRIVNKLLHDPIQVLRDSEPAHAPMTQYLHAVEKLFKLEDDDASKPEGQA
ncbi:MAG: glutamyl-tRNA reductase [Tepidisphaeraceae bacterium]|jgi:glutamyl-tRNA reductase